MTKGELIKKARKAAGFTQMQLATALKVSQVQISEYETGKRSPKAETLYRISEALHISYRDLLPDDYTPTWEDSVFSLGDAFVDAKRQREKLLNYYDSVDQSGKAYIVDYAGIIASHPGFKKEEYDPDPDDIPSEWSDPNSENK